MGISAIFRSKYFYLLASLLCYFLISPLLIENQLSNAILSLFISFIIVFCVNIIMHKKIFFFLSIFLGCIALGTHWISSLIYLSQTILIIHYTAILTFLIIMLFFVISSITEHNRITKDTLLGAICGYFLIGMTWTEIYLLIFCIEPQSFTFHSAVLSLRDLSQHFSYFSFETLTTLGYGDILPLTDVARTFSWLEAAAGQIYLAVWISQLVGLRIAQLVNGHKA